MLTHGDREEIKALVAEAVKGAAEGIKAAVAEGFASIEVNQTEPKVTRERIMDIKDSAVRVEMIRRHPEAFDPSNLPEEERIALELAEKRRNLTDPEAGHREVVEKIVAEEVERISQIEDPEERRDAIGKIGGAYAQPVRRALIERFAEDFKAKPKKNKNRSRLLADARKKVQAAEGFKERRKAILSIEDREIRREMVAENPELFVDTEEEDE